MMVSLVSIIKWLLLLKLMMFCLDQTIRKYLVPAIGVVSLVAENVLSHPFVVIRRQCQVNPTLKRYHLQPITLIPKVFRLNQIQGISVLWKGLGSCLLIRGVSLAFDDVIHKLTMWPKWVPFDILVYCLYFGFSTLVCVLLLFSICISDAFTFWGGYWLLGNWSWWPHGHHGAPICEAYRGFFMWMI